MTVEGFPDYSDLDEDGQLPGRDLGPDLPPDEVAEPVSLKMTAFVLGLVGLWALGVIVILVGPYWPF